MKNLWKKATLFLLIFGILFIPVQSALRYKWEKDENMSIRMEQYEAEPKDSIDVLYFGSSPIYAGLNPMFMWEQYGITSYNFGVSMQSALTTYYQIEYALKYQRPKAIVIDLCALTQSREADDSTWEPVYRKVVETMPDKEIKWRMINDIVKYNQNQTYSSYLFPLLRYHSRWNELTQWDFDEELWYKWYESYRKGALLQTNIDEMDGNDLELKIGNEDLTVNQINSFYYDKIVELCDKNNIELIAITMPKYDNTWDLSQRRVTANYCKEKEITYIDYSIPERLEEIGIDFSKDFYNSGHLNIYGARKVTEHLGGELKRLAEFEDHSQDARYEDWNQQFEAFQKDYAEKLEIIKTEE